MHRHDGVIAEISVEDRKKKRRVHKILLKSELLFFFFATHALQSLKKKEKKKGLDSRTIKFQAGVCCVNQERPECRLLWALAAAGKEMLIRIKCSCVHVAPESIFSMLRC